MQRRRLIAGAGWICAGAAWGGWPEIIAATRPSVLPIGTWDPLASPRFAFFGTAFVVGDGLQVVTNQHVINAKKDPKDTAPAQWVVQLNSGDQVTWRELSLVRSDAVHDLALLRLQGRPLPALPLAQDERLREGLAVLLMGFPIGGVLGFQPVTHRGMVSSVAPIALPAGNVSRLADGALRQLRRGVFDIVQLDATAYPGNSGGPVLDAETGEVVAVVNMVLVKGSREAALTHPSGISYAIPVRWVRELLDQTR
jgi:S1-C subfamily serine protease